MAAIKKYRMSVLALFILIELAAGTHTYAQNYSVLHNFGNSGDGASPEGAVVQGRDGSLYSTSIEGGSRAEGTIFKVTPAGKESILYSFCSQTNCTDGTVPVGGLTLRPNGHFLGTTRGGGSGSVGTIFDVSQTGSLTTLYSFTGGPDGATPLAAPILGPDGSFYGVASSGGRPSGCGTLYRITGSTFTPLFEFDLAHGCNPSAPLVLGTDGNFYGTLRFGGTAFSGVIYKVTLRPGMATVVTVLANFDSSNGQPLDALVEGSDGNFYGTTCGCTPNAFGSVFKITPSGALTILHAFNGTTDGSQPVNGLVLATDGNFYGTTTFGGAGGAGTLFQITPVGSFSVLHNFQANDGSSPQATPFQHTNGLLYGDTAFGGVGSICVGCGTFYSLDASLPASVSTVPFIGKVGSFVEILGQGFTSSTTVSFNGTPAAVTVVSGTYLRATVPAGATTGPVMVTTSSGTLTSNRQFVVTP